MRPETVRALDAINRRFYSAHAEAFAAKRERPWTGWARVLDAAGPPPSPLRVLDIGCGHGRFAAYLLRELAPASGGAGVTLHYTGVDSSEPLLAAARRAPGGQPLRDSAPRLRWLHADAITGDPAQALPEGPYDLVVLFGVLHHVPGTANREALLRAALARTAPGGLLAATWWRFGASARHRARILPWADYAPEDLDLADLEPGDHLLAWGHADDAIPPRYCHDASAAERESLATRLPARAERFESDGRLNSYLLLRPEPAGR